MIYRWKVYGLDMNESIFIEMEGESVEESLNKVIGEVQELKLEWDGIELAEK